MSSPFPQSRGGDRVRPHQPDSSSEDPSARWPAWRGYTVALLATAAATLGTEATWPLLQPTIFLLYFAAVAVHREGDAAVLRSDVGHTER